MHGHIGGVFMHKKAYKFELMLIFFFYKVTKKKYYRENISTVDITSNVINIIVTIVTIVMIFTKARFT